MRRIFALTLSLMMIIAFTEGCKTAKVAAYSPVGTWDYTFADTPYGDISGKLMLAQNGEGYTMTLNRDGQSTEVKDLKMEGNTFTGTFEAEGYDIGMQGTFEGESLKGMISAAGYEFPMTATRSSK